MPMMYVLTPPNEVGSSLHGVTARASSNEGAGRPTVVLTFDDGPRRRDTDAVVAELARADAHATFFTLLVRARAERHLLADILAAGHEVALHGNDHGRLTRGDPARLPGLLRDARAELENLAGAPIRFFRPAYGAQNRAVWHATVDAGLVPVVWQRECREWDAGAPEKAFKELENLKPGMIVLAHDTVALAADGAEPLDVLPVDRAAFTAAVLARFEAQGLVATSLSRALCNGAPAWRIWLDAHALVPAQAPAVGVR
jgi:peptidoglycan/xylan/chitin deacetylase (PgdA/CDA1 family)